MATGPLRWVPPTKPSTSNETEMRSDVHSRGGIGVMTHEELVLMSALAKLNQRIAQFVLGFLDAETGTAEYALSPEDEQGLGARMVELGEQLQEHGRGRGVVVEARHNE